MDGFNLFVQCLNDHQNACLVVKLNISLNHIMMLECSKQAKKQKARNMLESFDNENRSAQNERWKTSVHNDARSTVGRSYQQRHGDSSLFDLRSDAIKVEHDNANMQIDNILNEDIEVNYNAQSPYPNRMSIANRRDNQFFDSNFDVRRAHGQSVAIPHYGSSASGQNLNWQQLTHR